MDPTFKFSKIYNSFQDKNYYIWKPNFFENKENNITIFVKKINIHILPEIEFCDKQKYEILENLQTQFSQINFNKYRKLINPFERLGNSIFSNRAGVKLANIDALFKILNIDFNINLQNEQKVTFCDIAGGPGSFSEYINFRYQNNVGYGITLKDKSIDWNTMILPKNFNIFDGGDKTGNLFTNSIEFVNFVLKNENEGVDLVVGDGGFEIKTKKENLNLEQEFLSSKLIIFEIYTGLSCLKKGGNMLMKFFSTNTKISRDILYIVSLCFEKITLIKPSSSRILNSEKYLFCKNKKDSVRDYIDILNQVVKKYDNENYVCSFIEGKENIEFDKWLIEINNKFIDKQIKYSNHLKFGLYLKFIIISIKYLLLKYE
jgi:cap1 methyltransferase